MSTEDEARRRAAQPEDERGGGATTPSSGRAAAPPESADVAGETVEGTGEKGEGSGERRQVAQPVDETGWRAKAQEHYHQFLRARADYDNLVRRTQRDVAQMIRQGKQDLFLRLLDLADNLELAVGSWREALKDARGVDGDALTGGVEMIGRQLQTVLAAEGVQPIEAIGRPFDPALHEAVAAFESAEVEVDTVTDEIRRGYTYQGELLRAARVRVARPAAEAE